MGIESQWAAGSHTCSAALRWSAWCYKGKWPLLNLAIMPKQEEQIMTREIPSSPPWRPAIPVLPRSKASLRAVDRVVHLPVIRHADLHCCAKSKDLTCLFVFIVACYYYTRTHTLKGSCFIIYEDINLHSFPTFLTLDKSHKCLTSGCSFQSVLPCPKPQKSGLSGPVLLVYRDGSAWITERPLPLNRPD